MLMLLRCATLLSVLGALLLHAPFVTAQTTRQSTRQDYPAVNIAGLWWMQQNLTVTRYRNGDSIPDATAYGQAWANLKQGAWAYPDSNMTMRSTFGVLYNWYAVSDPRGLCPTGWRLPTHNEWTALTNALGGETKAGAKLKGKVGWFPGLEGRDELGFQGLPAGFRGSDGTFGGVGAYAYWWSSTASGINGAWGRFVDGTQPSIFMMDGFKKSAFSVRCVRKVSTGKAGSSW